MKLFGCTMVKNEEGMIPYVMPYVERLGYDKFVVYDDSSTDNTVAELSKYPFVEIRTTDGTENFDKRKQKIQANFFSECYQYIMSNNNEDVWMTFTDFDEVLYYHKQLTFKKYLESMQYHGYNYFEGQMIQLFWPESCRNNNIVLSLMDGQTLIHEINGIRCGIWTSNECFKPVLLHVNSFEEIVCYAGNHVMEAKPHKGIVAKNLDKQHTIEPFHLKYIDKEIVKNKIEQFDFGIKGHFDDTYYNSMLGSSFPIDMYFAYRCMTYQKENECGMVII